MLSFKICRQHLKRRLVRPGRFRRVFPVHHPRLGHGEARELRARRQWDRPVEGMVRPPERHLPRLAHLHRPIVSHGRCNLDAVEGILAAVDIPVELGGGIRTIETVEELLRLGVGRVILGTVAVERPELVETVCRKFGEQVVVGIDARDGIVATRGWLESTTATAVDLAYTMVGLGATRFIYTDIGRDGTLTSPNFEATAEMVSRVSVPVIAAGGISSVEDLTRLAALGVEGAVVGRAIYTGDVSLPEALQRIPRQPEQD